MDINISHFLFISAALFAIGFYAAIRRRNIILVLIGIELIQVFEGFTNLSRL